MNCHTCAKPMTGRKRKYCQPQCRPTFYKPKRAGLSHCQICGTKIEPSPTGRPKRNCSRKCRIEKRARNIRKKPFNRTCQICQTPYRTVKKDSKFCQAECRKLSTSKRQAEQHRVKMRELYPDGLRTVDCGWCGEPRTFDISESTPTAYHESCTKEARSARYRIKTVKRQKVSKPYRISHEQIFRDYGSNCHVCQEPIDLELPRTNRFGFTVDHLIPISKGGTDAIENLRPAHWICNIRKSDKMPKVDNA